MPLRSTLLHGETPATRRWAELAKPLIEDQFEDALLIWRQVTLSALALAAHARHTLTNDQTVQMAASRGRRRPDSPGDPRPVRTRRGGPQLPQT